jgi:hypothetical protein
MVETGVSVDMGPELDAAITSEKIIKPDKLTDGARLCKTFAIEL